MTQDELFIKRIRDLANLSWRRGVAASSDFLSLYEQSLVLSQEAKLPGVSLAFYGGYPQAERRIAVCFLPELSAPEEEALPIDCLFIRPKSAKFAQPMNHRDYLGALVHLGIERSVLGDILVEEEGAYLFCLKRMTDFITDSLERVKRNAVTVSRVLDPGDLPKPRTETIQGTVASVRLDSLISLAFRESRSGMSGLIEGGLVFVNGKQMSKSSFEPQCGDLISVRGHGRFLYEELGRATKKGRVNVTLQRYV